MELKPGYKQTEVGLIPEDWEVSPISAMVADFRGGAPFRPSDFTRSGVKVLPKGGVGKGGYLRVAHEDLQFCTQEYADSHPRNQVDKAFTIVVLRDLVPSGPSIGLMVQIEDSECYVLAQGVYGIKVNEGRAVSGYLVQLSNTVWYRRLVNSIMVGSTQVHITNTAFKKAQLPLPRIPEQRAIAGALEDVDALVGALTQLIAKMRAIKQAAMQQLLTGKKRLPGFTGRWEPIRAGAIGKFRGGIGFSLKLQGKSEGTYPFYKVSDMNNEGNETFMTVSNNWISESIRKTLGATPFPANCIVFAKVGAAIFLERKKILTRPSCIDNNMMAFVLNPDRADFRFIHYWLLGTKLGALVATTALPSLNGRQLAELRLALPPLSEQTAIAAILSDMDADIAALEQRRDKTCALKQGMMQELLTGRIRLV